jgi:hypothetical protein
MPKWVCQDTDAAQQYKTMPMDHTNPDVTNSLSNEELVKNILDGKGKFMPAWRGILSQTDVEAHVSYIRLQCH